MFKQLTLEEKLKVLKKAKGRIWYKKNWTTGICARDSDNASVHSKDPNAICWCAYGAIVWATANYPQLDEVVAYIEEIVPIVKENSGIVAINDKQGHEAIIRVFNQAIKSHRTQTPGTNQCLKQSQKRSQHLHL